MCPVDLPEGRVGVPNVLSDGVCYVSVGGQVHGYWPDLSAEGSIVYTLPSRRGGKKITKCQCKTRVSKRNLKNEKKEKEWRKKFNKRIISVYFVTYSRVDEREGRKE